MRTRKHQYAFAGGEITPEMYGRGDAAQYQTGVAKARNFVIKPQGTARTRAGFSAVRRCWSQSTPSPLLPFRFSDKQAFAVELGNTAIRFHTDGGTVSWSLPLEIEAVDTNTDTITTTQPHGLATGDPVRLVPNTGATLPAPFTIGTDYLVLVIDARRFQIDTASYPSTPSTLPINITSEGTGLTRVFPGALLPSDYFEPTTFAPGVVTLGPPSTIRLTVPSVLRALKVGDAVRFTTTGTLPAPLVAGVDYTLGAVTVVTSTTIDIELEGVTLTSTGTGTHTILRSYLVGDLVFLPAAKAPFAAGAVLYCRTAQLSTAGSLTGTQWATQTPDGILTVPSPYLAADLFDIGFDQSGDVLTLVHPSYPVHELRRRSATQWALVVASLSPSLAAPAAPTVTPNYGEQVQTASVTASAGGAGSQWVSATNGVSVGDALLCTVSNYPSLTVGQVYIVNAIGGTYPTGWFELRTLQGAQLVGGASANPNAFAFTDLIGDDNVYRVAAVDDAGAESLSASSATIRNNLANPGASNAISWAAVAGAVRYRVYRKQQGEGVFGLIAETEATSLTDTNLPADLAKSAPQTDSDFASAENRPRATARFEQRRCFGGSDAFPRRLFMSRSGTETDFSFRIPVQDDDRISVEVAAREAHTIRHIVPLGDLLLFTNQGEWRVYAINSDAITPTTIAVRPQSYVGSSTVRPQVVNTSVVYCAARGGHVRELGYNAGQRGFTTGDLSLRAAHLFDNFDIVSSAYQKAPAPVVWFVSTSGKLLGLTYVPEEQVGAWHQHDTDGVFESVCVIPDGIEDRVYVTVARQVNGATVRTVERMGRVNAPQVLDSVCVDGALRYDGTGTGALTITGGHRAGDTVTITSSLTTAFSVFDEGSRLLVSASGIPVEIVDYLTPNSVRARLLGALPETARATPISTWAVARQRLTGLDDHEGVEIAITWADTMGPAVRVTRAKVTGGAVTLPGFARIADAGRPFTCDLRLLPVTLQMDALGYGREKALNHAWLRVFDAAGLSVGVHEDTLRPVAELQAAGGLLTTQTRSIVPADWSDDAQLLIRQDQPLPATIAAVTIEVSVAE